MGKTYGKKSTEAKSIIFDQIKNSQSLEIIRAQFLICQHFLVFDKRKKLKIGNPFSLKRQNDVLKDKSIFDSLSYLQNHVMIQTLVKAFPLVYFTICINLLLPHTIGSL